MWHDETFHPKFPVGRHDADLLQSVRPGGWRNPEPARRYNLVVIGAGPAGLVAARGAAAFGARVALVERHLIGGDCLNVGCVPSKALIRSSRIYADMRNAAHFGAAPPADVEVDFALAMERIRHRETPTASVGHHVDTAVVRRIGSTGKVILWREYILMNPIMEIARFPSSLMPSIYHHA